jgi:hypothetical protein
MIVLAIFLLLVFLLLLTPWRQLSPSARLWALAGCINAGIFFSMRTTPATSPWRPVVARVIAACAGASFVVALVGLVLRWREGTDGGAGAAWLAPFVIGALPGVFYVFFWIIGPLY